MYWIENWTKAAGVHAGLPFLVHNVATLSYTIICYPILSGEAIWQYYLDIIDYPLSYSTRNRAHQLWPIDKHR